MGECKGQGSTEGLVGLAVLRSPIKKLMFLHFLGMKIFLLGTEDRDMLATTAWMVKWIQHMMA